MEMLQVASKLSPDDYHSLCCELIKNSPCTNENLKKEMNLIRDSITWRSKHQGRSHQPASASESARGHQRNDDPGVLLSRPDVSRSACGHQRKDDPGAFEAQNEAGDTKTTSHGEKFSDKMSVRGHQSNDDPGASKTFQTYEKVSSPASKVCSSTIISHIHKICTI